MNRDRTLFKHFGLDADDVYWGPQHEKYAEVVRAAVESRRMIGVVARFGAGKSWLVRHALQDAKKLALVYVNNPDRERLKIGQIMTALIDALSGETIRRDVMARSTQLARILGETVTVQNTEVCLVIENAHRLHANTLLALKDLRESAIYRGRAFLFSVVLVGQEPLRAKLERYGEVRYRTKCVGLGAGGGWMTFAERCRYLGAIYKDTIELDTRARLARMFGSPLELDHYIEGKLEYMRDLGLDVLDQRDVPITLLEQREANKITLRELEKITGLSTKDIRAIERGEKQDGAAARDLQQAIDNLSQPATGRAA